MGCPWVICLVLPVIQAGLCCQLFRLACCRHCFRFAAASLFGLLPLHAHIMHCCCFIPHPNWLAATAWSHDALFYSLSQLACCCCFAPQLTWLAATFSWLLISLLAATVHFFKCYISLLLLLVHHPCALLLFVFQLVPIGKVTWLIPKCCGWYGSAVWSQCTISPVLNYEKGCQ